MIVPILLLGMFGAAFGATLVLPGLQDWLLLTGPCMLASLYLTLRTWWRLVSVPVLRHILIDGSNVMHWKDGTPQIATVREVVTLLVAQGWQPGVVFDANAGYKIGDRYQDDRAMAALLGLPVDRVLVVPKGNQADPTLLAAARDLGAPIVTNDRYRDWAETYPEVLTQGLLRRGGYRDGKVWLDLPLEESDAKP